MWTRKTSSFVLTSLLALGLAIPSVVGYAAGGDPSLVTAAKNDDLQGVRAQIAKHVNVNEPARATRSTALLWAVYNSNVDMTRALIAAGAPVNAPESLRHHAAAAGKPFLGDANLIGMLVKAGCADVGMTHPDGETPLMAAARTGHRDADKLLIEGGANANVADSFQQETPLMWAAAEGHVDVVNLLLKAGADPDRKAHISGLDDRKHGDYPTGGFTALMFATRNGYDDVAAALIKGGADPKVTNGDGLTASMVAVVNDRFDMAARLVELGADANDGSLYFAVDMHDATTDMRAHDGSRLRADHPNKLTSLDLIKLLLDKGADPNKAFQGQVHSTTLCCDPEVNSSPFYRAAIAADVDAMKLMLAKGAKVDWSPAEVKKPGAPAAAGRGANANVGKTAMMMAMNGGRGAAFSAGPGFDRIGAPPFREAANRDPIGAMTLLIGAGADVNAKGADGSSLLHQAVTAKQVPIIQLLVAKGAKLDAVNKENQTPLMLAEKPEPVRSAAAAMQQDPGVYKRPINTHDEVVASLRELMKLGKDDPTPQPPPLADVKKDE